MARVREMRGGRDYDAAWGQRMHGQGVWAELLRQVLLMLSEELEEKPRRAFLLARLEGLSYADIAAELQVSESSVKQYLAKALAHCHGRLYGHL